jgi:hypothetical protein
MGGARPEGGGRRQSWVCGSGGRGVGCGLGCMGTVGEGRDRRGWGEGLSADLVGQVSDAGCVDDPDEVEAGGGGFQVVEQADAAAEQDGH